MIPILYDSYEVEFTSNGLGRLADCTRCVVTEECNGIYECEFEYPISGEMYSKISEGCVIAATHDDGHDIQPFDIYARSAPLDGVVTFYAHHISYRMNNIILKPFTAESCAAALADMATKTYNRNPFTFWTDKSVSSTWTNSVPLSVRAALAGESGSILDVYGKGEYQFDKWTVRLYANRGSDNGVSIRYGVNLIDLMQEYDQSETYTAAAPFWKSNEDNTVVTLPEGIIVSTLVESKMVPWTTESGEIITTGDGDPIYVSIPTIKPVAMDLSEAFQDEPTVEQLRAEALRRLNNSEAWLPDDNITVKFVDLANTEDYKDVAALQRVRLCDKVSVYCGPLGVSAVKMQVIRVVYNTLTESYDEIELGKAKTTFASTILKQVEDTVASATADLATGSQLQTAIDNATNMITGAMNSHVKFIYDADGGLQEIVVMDTDDINTAVNVWRWNSGGLGFSSNGYAGPYSTAMTADGQIVADMITTGRLNADLIKTGTLDGELIKAKLLQIVNENGDVIASFRDLIEIGKGVAKVQLNYGTFTVVNNLGNNIVSIGDIKQEDGCVYVTETFTGDGSTVNFYISSFGGTKQNLQVFINGTETTDYTHPSSNRIQFNTAPASGATIKVTYYHTSSIYAFTFGSRKTNQAVGHISSAFGNGVVANGPYSFANGSGTTASGDSSHAEGGIVYTQDFGPIASGNASHAEGVSTIASGAASHAEGIGTIASAEAQHSSGKWNIEMGSSYLEVVGNGSRSSRSNARTLSTNGNEWIAGTLTQASDQRLKTVSGDVPDVSGIRARRFRWTDEKRDDLEHIGYFAQEVEAIAPYLVGEDASGYKSLDYIGLLCAKIESLERRIAELEKERESHVDN